MKFPELLTGDWLTISVEVGSPNKPNPSVTNPIAAISIIIMPINPIMMGVLFFSTLIYSFICDPQVGQYDAVSSFNFSPHLLQYFVMIIVICFNNIYKSNGGPPKLDLG